MSITSEAIDYVCADCGSTTWELKIVHESDELTTLLVICSNQQCVENKKHELNIRNNNNAYPIWDEFNITGQGKDKADLELYEYGCSIDKNQVN